MPCLHDGPYAYLEIFQPVFSGVRGLWVLSEPEHQLAHRICRLPATHQVVGAGVTVPREYDPDGFCKRHEIEAPFVLYAGRREGAKGWDELVEGFGRAVTRLALPHVLVTMGVGEPAAPRELRDRVIDLGFVDQEER